MSFVDIHAHLDSEGLYERLDEVVKSAEENGVEKIITSGADLKSSLLAVEIANKFPNVFATIGIHPQDADGYDEKTEHILYQLCAVKCVQSMVSQEFRKVVGYGEFGLDYHYENCPSKEVQKDVFIKQLVLADKLKLPVVLHVRDAMEDALAILKANKNLLKHGGVMHCFAGDVNALKEVLELGFLISVGGVLTFKKNKLEEVVKEAGLDNIVLETDCPWLAPEPFRGKLNEPKYIPLIAKKLAEVLNCSLKEVEEKTTANVKRVFHI